MKTLLYVTCELLCAKCAGIVLTSKTSKWYQNTIISHPGVQVDGTFLNRSFDM